jgi:hypothetical protein
LNPSKPVHKDIIYNISFSESETHKKMGTFFVRRCLKVGILIFDFYLTNPSAANVSVLKFKER